MLPPIDPGTGFLPLGAHQATLDDIRQRFVDEAPHARDRRVLVFKALETYFQILRMFFPSGLALVDGGFTTHKVDAPHDVDVAILPDDPSLTANWNTETYTDFQGILTLQDVIIGGQDAAYFQRVQPFAGLLDSFIFPPEREQYWRNLWGASRGPDNQPIWDTKGYLEVRW